MTLVLKGYLGYCGNGSIFQKGKRDTCIIILADSKIKTRNLTASDKAVLVFCDIISFLIIGIILATVIIGGTRDVLATISD